MKNRKMISYYSYFMCFVGLTLSFILLFKAIIPIWSIDINEQDKKKIIGMRTNVLSEYRNNGKPFWWLENKKNKLIFDNDSDEDIEGIITLMLSQNPCKAQTNFELELTGKLVRQFSISRDYVLIQVPLERINAFSSIEISLNPISYISCPLNNGDKRELVAKLEDWYFE